MVTNPSRGSRPANRVGSTVNRKMTPVEGNGNTVENCYESMPAYQASCSATKDFVVFLAFIGKKACFFFSSLAWALVKQSRD